MSKKQELRKRLGEDFKEILTRRHEKAIRKYVGMLKKKAGRVNDALQALGAAVDSGADSDGSHAARRRFATAVEALQDTTNDMGCELMGIAISYHEYRTWVASLWA